MLSFRFFGFPVSVHWMFWLVTALLGSAGNLRSLSDVPELVTWVAVVFISILWHELGHALMQRRYGRRSRIVLYGMGGLTISEGGGVYSRIEQIVTAAAGPVFSLILGTVVYGIYMSGLLEWVSLTQVAGGAMVRTLVSLFLTVNFFWTVMNILPVFPLDGGQILRGILGDYRQTAQVGMVVGALTALVGFVWLGSSWIGLLFGLLAYENFQRARGAGTGSFLGGGH